MTPKLGLFSKTDISEVRELSEDEYHRYKKSSESIFSFSMDQQLFTIVLLNYDDFIKGLKKYAEGYSKNPGQINSIMMEKMMLDLNRFLLNYLSSVKSFLDHNEEKLNNNFGNQSDRFKRFKDVRSRSYDSYFSYRFLSKLRDYSQHCGMPIGNIKGQSEENPQFSGNIICSFEAQFVRDKLLEFKRWGAQIKKELPQLPSNFDVVPHVEQMMKCIEKINIFLINEDTPELVKSVEFIEELIKTVRDKDGTPCILEKLKINRGKNKKVKGLTFQINHIPFHIMEIIKKF